MKKDMTEKEIELIDKLIFKTIEKKDFGTEEELEKVLSKC